ncbi:MAG: carbohydrate binding domain-containing protein [Candidatus Poribacteria bacterium]
MVEDGKAVPVTSGENVVKNGDFEEYTGNRFAKYRNQVSPGKVSFVDTKVYYSGKTSIRFENLHLDYPYGRASVVQAVYLKPGFTYRLTCMVKTENLETPKRLRVKITTDHGGTTLGRADMRNFEPTQDWKKIKIDFDVFTDEEIWLDIGSWKAKSGKFWLDDIQLRESGALTNIVRREGTPLSLESEDGTQEYIEGVDFLEIPNSRNLKHVTILPCSSIQGGQKLILSCYKMSVFGKQKSLCMSNPKLYTYWESLAEKLHSIIGFKKAFLSMDEIRNGGGCYACQSRQKRGMTMAQILGDCVTKQYNIFKKIDKAIEVFIWSDMFDPNHNARDNFYNVVGDFTGSWQYVPKGLIMVCWSASLKEQSLPFFSEQGFRTFGSVNMDGGTLEDVKGWLNTLDKTKDAIGIMYTTWQGQYELLAPFGDLVSGE